jgi:DNA replicative helicase MCM subunit Mcm2 (Cdc46/Mcm family)
MMNEACYVCESCGEEIVIPIDITGGRLQEYVEDCPVCCRANIVHLEINGGRVTVWSESE